MVDANKPMPSPVMRKVHRKNENQSEVAADGHSKPPVTDSQHFDRVEEAEDDVRHQFADDQLPGTDGRDDQLFDGAALTFPHH